MIQALGVLCFVYVVLTVSVNGLCMLISPQAWNRLPGWIRASGGLMKLQYVNGWGAIQVRLVGACFIGAVLGLVWVVFHNYR